jgi:proline iminopeptidase
MRVAVNGTDIYFDVDGSELEASGSRLTSRPTLVALHGGPGFDQGYLRPGLEPLRRHAQVLYPDLRGQGRSGRPPLESCTLEQMADDLAALCAIVGIEHPVVFGHSAGGFVAMHLAIRHPTLPSGLILCDTAATLAPLPDDHPPASLLERGGEEAVAAGRRLFGGDFSTASLEAFERLVWPLYAAPGHEDIPARLMSLSTIEPNLVRHFFSKLAPAYDVRQELAAISAPTLVLVGSHDWVCPPAASRDLARRIPGSELVELSGSGHFGFSEEPEAFMAAVGAYLRRFVERPPRN